MTDPEDFLSRWSRKKIEEKSEEQREGKRAAPEPPAPAAKLADAAATAPEVVPPQSGGAEKPAADPKPVEGALPPAEPVFDPASLPSIDSIGEQTDIRAFLRPGVPADLTRAALRRAWLADPAIRNFKGLAENDWDFNDPTAMAGFGPLGPDVDIKKLLAAVFGEAPKEDSQVVAGKIAEAEPSLASKSADAGESGVSDAASAPQHASDSVPPPPHSGGALPLNTSEPFDLVQRDKNIAAQK
jgi:hypothetical protein